MSGLHERQEEVPFLGIWVSIVCARNTTFLLRKGLEHVELGKLFAVIA